MPDDQHPTGPRYDDDFYAWTQYQAEVLRAMPAPDNRFDREHVAEEIEDLGKSERDAVQSQVTRVLEHFLKLAHSPADRPRYGWMRSIAEARASIRKKMSPTLHREAQAVLPALYEEAREQARLGLREHAEDAAADALPPECPYTLGQILQWAWYPDPPKPTADDGTR
jgi:hypothetical protein